MNGWVLPEGLLRDAPSYAPRTRELADLELLLSGALTPLTGFHTSADLDAIRSHAHLADGTPCLVVSGNCQSLDFEMIYSP